MNPAVENPVWSRTRASALDECRRKYVLTALSEADLKKIQPAGRPAPASLKKIKNRHLWFGSVVHEEVASLLRILRQGDGLPEKSAFIESVKNRMRADYQSSAANADSSTRLFEHHYHQAVPPAGWKAKWTETENALDWFYDSPWMARLQALGPENWKAIDEIIGFDVEGIKAYVKIDCALEMEGKFILLDWVTGSLKSGPSDSLLLAALYAHQVWDADPGSIDAHEVSLKERKYRRIPIDEDQLIQMVVRIHEEAEKMSRVEWPVNGDPLQVEGPVQSDSCFRCSFQGFCHPGGVHGSV